ncbi:MAG: cysteine desulfurase [Lachnospiraceae bacterium]|nr:cysteine desulfurase [Lachnospiraceae bacterium]
MEAYLDNAATTRVSEKAAEIAEKVMREDYGNPSSKHIKGFDAEQYIKNSAKIISDSLKVQPKEIIFTSGGTESNNMALSGAAFSKIRSGKRIIASCFEHASVYSPLLALKDFDFEIDFAPVDEMGHIKIDELTGMIDDNTTLVSVMYVNNEVGAVQDIAIISKAIKEKKPDIIFHVDAIQAYGKYRINPKKDGIDLLSVSGHKIHAPKGSGFLYADEKIKLRPLIFGGGQQKNRRSGTENVPAIAGLGEAVREAYEDFDKKIEHIYSLKEHFLERISEVQGTHVNAVYTSSAPSGDLLFEEKVDKCVDSCLDLIRKTAPHIVSISFDKIKAEVLLHALEEKGVYVSSGSACSSNHPGLSNTLQAIGVKRELLDSTLRFSFSRYTAMEEIDYCIDVLKELVPIYSRFTRK